MPPRKSNGETIAVSLATLATNFTNHLESEEKWQGGVTKWQDAIDKKLDQLLELKSTIQSNTEVLRGVPESGTDGLIKKVGALETWRIAVIAEKKTLVWLISIFGGAGGIAGLVSLLKTFGVIH